MNLHEARKHEPRLKSPHSGKPPIMSSPGAERLIGCSHGLSMVAGVTAAQERVALGHVLSGARAGLCCEMYENRVVNHAMKT
jgi:hypothetical protein